MLTVVGTGIETGGQLTAEARAAIAQADEVYFLMAEPVSVELLRRLNPRARALDRHYRAGEPRRLAYEAMTEEILAAVRRGGNVCAAFYGHPGVFCTPSHDAVRRARAEGFAARMLPGVSADGCLFADLGLDPGATGYQSYEAAAFLERRPPVDTAALLVLWQVSVLGHADYVDHPDAPALPALVDLLCRLYPVEHEVVLYEASSFSIAEPHVARLPLAKLAYSELPRLATLVVPPADASSAARTAETATALPLTS